MLFEIRLVKEAVRLQLCLLLHLLLPLQGESRALSLLLPFYTHIHTRTHIHTNKQARTYAFIYTHRAKPRARYVCEDCLAEVIGLLVLLCCIAEVLGLLMLFCCMAEVLGFRSVVIALVAFVSCMTYLGWYTLQNGRFIGTFGFFLRLSSMES